MEAGQQSKPMQRCATNPATSQCHGQGIAWFHMTTFWEAIQMITSPDSLNKGKCVLWFLSLRDEVVYFPHIPGLHMHRHEGCWGMSWFDFNRRALEQKVRGHRMGMKQEVVRLCPTNLPCKPSHCGGNWIE